MAHIFFGIVLIRELSILNQSSPFLLNNMLCKNSVPDNYNKQNHAWNSYHHYYGAAKHTGYVIPPLHREATTTTMRPVRQTPPNNLTYCQTIRFLSTSPSLSSRCGTILCANRIHVPKWNLYESQTTDRHCITTNHTHTHPATSFTKSTTTTKTDIKTPFILEMPCAHIHQIKSSSFYYSIDSQPAPNQFAKNAYIKLEGVWSRAHKKPTTIVCHMSFMICYNPLESPFTTKHTIHPLVLTQISQVENKFRHEMLLPHNICPSTPLPLWG